MTTRVTVGGLFDSRAFPPVDPTPTTTRPPLLPLVSRAVLTLSYPRVTVDATKATAWIFRGRGADG